MAKPYARERIWKSWCDSGTGTNYEHYSYDIVQVMLSWVVKSSHTIPVAKFVPSPVAGSGSPVMTSVQPGSGVVETQKGWDCGNPEVCDERPHVACALLILHRYGKAKTIRLPCMRLVAYFHSRLCTNSPSLLSTIQTFLLAEFVPSPAAANASFVVTSVGSLGYGWAGCSGRAIGQLALEQSFINGLNLALTFCLWINSSGFDKMFEETFFPSYSPERCM